VVKQTPGYYANMMNQFIHEHNTFEDERGSFTPIHSDAFDQRWDQFNISTNIEKFTFRGMHYQTEPPQTKCIKVIKGEIVDFWYNLKTHEVSYCTLTNKQILEVPSAFAHGFLTLEPNTIVSYLVRGKYNPKSEHSIPWHSIPNIKKGVGKYLGNNDLVVTSDKDS
jgi:dTDP-4-dehydrorhamnose 3,5-epimerase